MAPYATNHCSSWSIDSTPNSGEAVENGDFTLDQFQPDTSVDQLICLSPDTCDYVYQCLSDSGTETPFDGYILPHQVSDDTPEERLRQTLEKFKNVNSTKSHYVVAQLWFPVVMEGHFVLRQSNQYAFGALVNNDQIKKVYKRCVLDFFGKTFSIGSKSAQSLGVGEDEDIPVLSNLDEGSILVNRWVSYKAFQLQSVQWAPNIHIYTTNSGHYTIFGTLALPIFDSATNNCVGVFELVIDCPYVDYFAEIQDICKHLQEVSLVASIKLVNQPRQMVLLEIMKLLRNVSQSHNLPLAQTWLPCKCCGGDHNSKTMEICMSSAEIPFILIDSSLFPFWKTSSMYHMSEGQGVAGRAFQSKGSCFCNDITQFSDQNFPLVRTSREFGVYSSLAVCLKSSYTGDDIYIVQFFIRGRLTSVKHQKHFVDSIVKLMGQNYASLKLASSEFEEIIDAKLGKIAKRKWVSNICIIEEQNNNGVSSSTTGGVGHLSEVMVHKGKCPLVEFNVNTDVEYKKVRKKKTRKFISTKENLMSLLAGTIKDATEKLQVSKSTIKRWAKEFEFKNWSDAQKQCDMPPTKRRRKGVNCDEPSSSSGDNAGEDLTLHYTWITEEQWKQFLADRNTPEAKVEIKQKLTQGELREEPRADALVHLNEKPEHPSRVRGIPTGVCVKDYWPNISRRRPSGSCASITEEQIEKIARRSGQEEAKKEVHETLHRRWESFLASIGCNPTQDLSTQQVSLSTVRDAVFLGDPTHPSHDDHIKETLCTLNVMLGASKMVVARGLISSSRILHGKPLRDGVVKVRVVEAIQPAAVLPISVGDNITHVFHALWTYVPWLLYLCDVGSHDIKTSQPSKKEKHLHSEARVELVDWGGPKLNQLAKFCETYGSDDQVIKEIPISEEVFGFETYVFFNLQILKELLMNQRLDNNWIALCLRYIHETSKASSKNDFCFFSPFSLVVQGTKRELRISYMAERFLKFKHKHLFFVPILRSDHYSLAVICLRKHRVYFYNSINHDCDKNMYNEIKSAYCTFHVNRGPSSSRSNNVDLQWIRKSCPRQVLDWECGYYVMWMMIELLSRGVNDETIAMEEFPDCPHSRETINLVKERMVDYYFQCPKSNRG